MSSLDHERDFWGSCVNTWAEEMKQAEYAKRMGLACYGTWPRFDLGGRSIVDLGGGPVSMLLKTVNGASLTVVDPCVYPAWVTDRYEAHGVTYVNQAAETYSADTAYDECWVYNVLQHVDDPRSVIEVAKQSAATLRIFEWTGIPSDDLHPHTLTPDDLAEWCGGSGHADFGVNRAWGESHPAFSWSAHFAREREPVCS